MPFLRLGVLIMMVVLGVAGMLVGAVVTHSALSIGEIRYEATVQGQRRSTVVRRAEDAGAFWRTLAATGFAPLLIGAAALGYGWLRLRG